MGTTSPRRAYIIPSGRTVPRRLMTMTWSSATTVALTVLDPGQDCCACIATADNATTASRHATGIRDMRVLPEVSDWSPHLTQRHRPAFPFVEPIFRNQLFR